MGDDDDEGDEDIDPDNEDVHSESDLRYSDYFDSANQSTKQTKKAAPKKKSSHDKKQDAMKKKIMEVP